MSFAGIEPPMRIVALDRSLPDAVPPPSSWGTLEAGEREEGEALFGASERPDDPGLL